MSELTPELAAEVVAACEAGADELTGALGRALDGEFAMTVGEATRYAGDTASDGFDGPGLAVLFKFGDIGMAALVPESSGVLPDWYANPDPTGESKLSTLAQELSMLVVPESLMADIFEAARVEQLGSALASAGVSDDAALVPLELKAGDTTTQMSLVWPLAAPDALLPAGENAEENAAESPSDASAAASTSDAEGPSGPNDFSELPGYSRSLLKISVPLRVVLASKKESLSEVVELASGSIIQFEKSCDELLTMCVGDQEVAEGEAVKVGDKFGLRVTKMLMPEEHFMRVPPKQAG